MILGLGRSPGEGIGYPLVFLGFPCGSAGRESACNAGDLGSIPELGRSPGEGKGNPLQYSTLENSMDCIVHRISKSRRLSDFQFHSYFIKYIAKLAVPTRNKAYLPCIYNARQTIPFRNLNLSILSHKNGVF